jgi:serine protease Do
MLAKSFFLPLVLSVLALAPTPSPAIAASPALLAQMDTQSDSGGWLGVYLQDVNDDIARALDLHDSEGALVSDVVEDSPADEAGIHEGDVIVEADGEKVTDPDDLIKLVGRHESGDVLRLVVVRDGGERDIDVRLGERPEASNALRAPMAPAPSPRERESWMQRFHAMGMSGGARLGVHVVDMNDDLASYFKTRHGVLVVRVVDGSAADKAGIKAGDVITGIGGRDVENADELVEAIRGAESGQQIDVHLLRKGDERTVQATLERGPAFGGMMPTLRLPVRPHSRQSAPRTDDIQRQMRDLQRRMDALKRQLDRLENQK